MSHPRDESGFTIVEMMVSSLVTLLVLSMASISTVAMTRTSVKAIQRGNSTGPAFLAVQEVEQTLSGAWTQTSTSGITLDCTEGSNGTQFTSTSPFVPLPSPSPAITGTDMSFCAIMPGSSISRTYEMHFTNCSGTGVCTLQTDQEPDPGCSPTCTVKTVDSIAGVFDDEAGTPPVAPFTYYNSAGGVFVPTAATLDQIQSVQVTLDVLNSASGGNTGATVQRMVLLPNALRDGGS